MRRSKELRRPSSARPAPTVRERRLIMLGVDCAASMVWVLASPLVRVDKPDPARPGSTER